MNATRRSGTHGYICECTAAYCRERLYLTPSEYEALAFRGAVMSAECAVREGRAVLATANGAMAVRSMRIVL